MVSISGLVRSQTFPALAPVSVPVTTGGWQGFAARALRAGLSCFPAGSETLVPPGLLPWPLRVLVPESLAAQETGTATSWSSCPGEPHPPSVGRTQCLTSHEQNMAKMTEATSESRSHKSVTSVLLSVTSSDKTSGFAESVLADAHRRRLDGAFWSPVL